MLKSIELMSFPPDARPQLAADVIAALVKVQAPPDAILTVEPDGTLRIVYYREVTGGEKLAEFIAANPDVTTADLTAAASIKT